MRDPNRTRDAPRPQASQSASTIVNADPGWRRTSTRAPLSPRQTRLNPRRERARDRAGNDFECASEAAAFTAGRGSHLAPGRCSLHEVHGFGTGRELSASGPAAGQSSPGRSRRRMPTEIRCPAIAAGRAGTGRPRRSIRSGRSTRCSVRLGGSWLSCMRSIGGCVARYRHPIYRRNTRRTCVKSRGTPHFVWSLIRTQFRGLRIINNIDVSDGTGARRSSALRAEKTGQGIGENPKKPVGPRCGL